ncbi:MAG: delta-60 repeat domain-containing protein, partial [Candidatus Paceibacterota bacterium]
MNNFNIKNNKGFVLLFTTILSSIVLAISIGVASIALKEINFSTSTKDTNEAFFSSDTGVECALYNDKSTNSVFQEGGPGMIECLGESIPLSGDFPVWSFVISGLGGDEDGCAKVVVDKSALPTVKVTSKGYNVGDTACESSNPYRVERELEVTFNEVAEEVEEQILVGGHFDFYDSVLAGCIARINTDGSLDTSFNIGTGFNSYIYSLITQSDGKILAGGYFTGYNGTTVNR